eukprot:3937962-Rhodomonas_salina.1
MIAEKQWSRVKKRRKRTHGESLGSESLRLCLRVSEVRKRGSRVEGRGSRVEGRGSRVEIHLKNQDGDVLELHIDERRV